MPQEISDGVLPGPQRRPTDFVAGEVSALPYEVRVSSADWTPYAPPGERQFNYRADSMSCVSFSAVNVIECQEKLLTGLSQNYSDRWIAKMSGTTKDGNWLYKVVDTIRQYGLVLESEYPTPKEPWTWEDYHAPIPEPLLSELKAKGQEWLNLWNISYEWVNNVLTPEGLKHHLKHAPIQLVFPYHAVCGVYNAADWYRYFDTYDPYMKTLNKNNFTDALKIVLTPKSMNQTKIVLSKNGTTVYKAVPIATDFENFKKQMSVEGITVPNPIPPSSDL